MLLAAFSLQQGVRSSRSAQALPILQRHLRSNLKHSQFYRNSFVTLCQRSLFFVPCGILWLVVSGQSCELLVQFVCSCETEAPVGDENTGHRVVSSKRNSDKKMSDSSVLCTTMWVYLTLLSTAW